MDTAPQNIRKQLAEKSDFPTLCETCLGPNPLLRMIKQTAAKQCKICDRPFTNYRWKPGPKARYKETVVCRVCAQVKNVCQTCLFDLRYGLPVQVCETFSTPHPLPQSAPNLTYHLEALEATKTHIPKPEPNPILERIARTAPYYRRNLPRICTFWLKGACNRGEECPYRHEKSEHDETIARQNIRARYRGEGDVLAQKILAGIGGPAGQGLGVDCQSGEYPSMDPREAEKRR